MRRNRRGHAMPWMLAALLALAISACGLKDDLYLPEPEPTAPPAEPADEDESDS